MAHVSSTGTREAGICKNLEAKVSLTHSQPAWHTAKAANARGASTPKTKRNRKVFLTPAMRDMVEQKKESGGHWVRARSLW